MESFLKWCLNNLTTLLSLIITIFFGCWALIQARNYNIKNGKLYDSLKETLNNIHMASDRLITLTKSTNEKLVILKKDVLEQNQYIHKIIDQMNIGVVDKEHLKGVFTASSTALINEIDSAINVPEEIIKYGEKLPKFSLIPGSTGLDDEK